MLYLTKDAYIGFIKLQADKGLGRSFAGQLIFTEGLYRLGYLSETVYHQLMDRYSQGLMSMPKVDVEKQKTVEKLEKDFSNVLKQWSSMNDKARRFWIRKASENKDLKNAQLILALSEDKGDLVRP